MNEKNNRLAQGLRQIAQGFEELANVVQEYDDEIDRTEIMDAIGKDNTQLPDLTEQIKDEGKPFPTLLSVNLPGQIGHPDNWWNQKQKHVGTYPSSREQTENLQRILTATHNWGLGSADGRTGVPTDYWLPKLDINMKESEPYGHHINHIYEDTDVKYVVPQKYTLDGPYDPHGDYLRVPVSPTFNLQNFGDSADSHLYVVDHVRREIREYYHVRNYGQPNMSTGLATVYPLDVVSPSRGLGCTSSNAAGDVYAPMLLTPDDFVRGRINRAVPITLTNLVPTGTTFIEPAQHTPPLNLGDRAGIMPYGARFLLDENFPVDNIPNKHAQTILRAAQEYGFYHIDGINGQSLIPCCNDTGFTNKWRDIPDMHPSVMWFYPELPEWTDFRMLDGEVHSMSDVRCVRQQVDERERMSTPAEVLEILGA